MLLCYEKTNRIKRNQTKKEKIKPILYREFHDLVTKKSVYKSSKNRHPLEEPINLHNVINPENKI